MLARSLICASVSVVALVQKPTCIPRRATPDDIGEAGMDGRFTAGQRDPLHPAGRQPGDQQAGNVVIRHRLAGLGG